jgi:hypothetical protein
MTSLVFNLDYRTVFLLWDYTALVQALELELSACSHNLECTFGSMIMATEELLKFWQSPSFHRWTFKFEYSSDTSSLTFLHNFLQFLCSQVAFHLPNFALPLCWTRKIHCIYPNLTDDYDRFKIAILAFSSILIISTIFNLFHQRHRELNLCGKSSMAVEFPRYL